MNPPFKYKQNDKKNEKNGAYLTSLNLNRSPRLNKSHHVNHLPLDFYRLKLSKSKLKAVTRTSALLSGFAMVAMVEFNLDYSSLVDPNTNQQPSFNKTLNSTASNEHYQAKNYKIPESILIIYAFVTCLLVGIHMLALMISTCILPQVEALSFEQIEFEQQMQKYEMSFYHNNNLNHASDESMINETMDNSTLSRRNIEQKPVLYDSILNHENIMYPYIQYHRFIELSWISSTVIGIFLFLVEIGLVCYIKFYPISFIAAMTGIVVMIPICVLFVIFTITFYKRLAGFKMQLTKKALSQVDGHMIPLHNHSNNNIV